MHGMNIVKVMTVYFMGCNSGGGDMATKHNQTKFQFL